jgi:type IV pilus assembly protein PilM
MPKSQSAWGIEIGAFAIKAIRLERDGDEVLVKDFAFIPHAKPLTSPDSDPTEITRLTLQQFIASKNLEEHPTVISVPGHVGLARFAKLPPVEPKKIPDIVKFEAAQQIPFPMEEVEWDYQTFSSDDNPEVEVGIFAITKDKIAERLSLYAEFGIRPEIVTLGPLAAFNALFFDLSLTEQSKPIVALDIGTQSSDVVIAYNGRCWVRTFPLGGTHFTDALAESFSIKYGKADKLKAESASSKYARQMMQAMRPVFGDLVTDVQRSMGHYQMSHPESPIEQVMGLGSTFRIPGLRKFLSQQLNIEVQRLDEFKRIRVEGREAADFAANSVNFVTAYGLALQGIGLARISVNLAPLRGIREKIWSAKNKWFIAAACVSVAASAGLFLRPALDSQALKSGEDAVRKAERVVQQGKGLKSQLDQANGMGQTGATVTNTMRLAGQRDVWPQIVRDAFAMSLSAKPGAELAAESPAALAALDPSKIRLIAIEDLSGAYVFGEEDKSRSIDVTVKVAFANMDRTAATFLNETAGKWLRENLDRPAVPYTIDVNTIKLKTDENPSSTGTAAPADPSAGAPAATDSGSAAASTPPPTQTAASGGNAAGDSQGSRSRRRRQGEGFGSESGSGLSKGMGSAGSDPLPTEVEDTGSSSAKPAAQTREEEKQSTDLEQVAPLDLQASVFGPNASVYRGEITFRVRLRDGAAKPAEGASNP